MYGGESMELPSGEAFRKYLKKKAIYFWKIKELFEHPSLIFLYIFWTTSNLNKYKMYALKLNGYYESTYTESKRHRKMVHGTVCTE